MKRLCFTAILMLCFSNPFIALRCQGQASSAGQPKDERAIRAADAKGLKAAQAKDVEGAIFNYGENATWLPTNAPIAEGKAAIRAGWSQLLATPGFSIDWQITKIEISRARDFAYTLYTYQLTMQGAGGKPIADRGKDLAVWKKRSNGTWKIVADTFNSDLLAPAPAKSQ